MPKKSKSEAAYDSCAKKILSNKFLIAHILKECLEEYKNVDIDYIVANCLNSKVRVSNVSVLPFIEQLKIYGDNIRFDVYIKAKLPYEDNYMLINLELQNRDNPGYPLFNRSLFYAATMINNQYGTEFIHSEYQNIIKVCTIWICPYPPQYKTSTILKYSIDLSVFPDLLYSKISSRSRHNLMEIQILNLGKQQEKGILDLLDTIFSDKLTSSEKIIKLRNVYNFNLNGTVQRRIETMCNLSQGLIQKGRMQGRKEGRKEEKNKNNKEFLDFLIKNTNDPELISRFKKEFHMTQSINQESAL